jgi:hypothetical protein
VLYLPTWVCTEPEDNIELAMFVALGSFFFASNKTNPRGCRLPVPSVKGNTASRCCSLGKQHWLERTISHLADAVAECLNHEPITGRHLRALTATTARLTEEGMTRVSTEDLSALFQPWPGPRRHVPFVPID